MKQCLCSRRADIEQVVRTDKAFELGVSPLVNGVSWLLISLFESFVACGAMYFCEWKARNVQCCTDAKVV